jgi:hypothetical protein
LQIIPTVTVKEDSAAATTLTVTNDYTVNNGANVNVTGGDSVTVTGVGNYTGTVVKNFAITPAALTWNTDGAAANKTYDGTNTATASPQPTLGGVIGSDDVTVVNGTLAFASANAASSIAVTATGYGITGTKVGNYTAPSGQPTFANAEITKTVAVPLLVQNVSHNNELTGAQSKSIATLMPSDAGTLTYTKGTATGNTGIVSAWDVDTTGLVSYTLVGGTAGQTVNLPITIGSTNYADSNAGVVITLTSKVVPIVAANDIDVTYSGTAIADSAITGTADVDGTWSFNSPPSPINANSGIPVIVKFTPDDETTYETVYDTITVTIAKKTVTVKAEDKTITKGNALPTPTVSYTGFAGTDDETTALDTQAVAQLNVAYSKLSPKDNATRAHVAAILHRFIELS